MAIKTALITIDAEGRDKGKMFHITELPADQIEWWAIRAFLALAKAGIEIPEEAAAAGIAGIAELGILNTLGRIHPEDAKPLLDELLVGVRIIPDASNPNFMRSDIKSDIEEFRTYFTLRLASFNLCSGFSQPVVTSNSTSMTGFKGRKTMRNT